jgi:hypothetical protein
VSQHHGVPYRDVGNVLNAATASVCVAVGIGERHGKDLVAGPDG